jgi:outer membrane protein assembly factor BamE (lipoprotein component of BamABCDE complex)
VQDNFNPRPQTDRKVDKRMAGPVFSPSSSSKTGLARFRALAFSVLLLAPVAACTTAGPQVQGYIIDEKAVAQIKPGMSAEQVLKTLGTPSTVSTVGNQAWYYISQNTDRTFMYDTPKITDQRVLTVVFTKALKVDRIANYGNKDGVLFDFNTNTTPAAGTELTVVRQMLRMVGAN